MLKEDEGKKAEVEVLRSKLAQLEKQEALLDQICMIKHEVSKAWRMGDISRAQELYNQAWEMERSQKNHIRQKDSKRITKEDIIKLARSIGLR